MGGMFGPDTIWTCRSLRTAVGRVPQNAEWVPPVNKSSVTQAPTAFVSSLLLKQATTSTDPTAAVSTPPQDQAPAQSLKHPLPRNPRTTHDQLACPCPSRESQGARTTFSTQPLEEQSALDPPLLSSTERRREHASHLRTKKNSRSNTSKVHTCLHAHGAPTFPRLVRAVCAVWTRSPLAVLVTPVADVDDDEEEEEEEEGRAARFWWREHAVAKRSRRVLNAADCGGRGRGAGALGQTIGFDEAGRGEAWPASRSPTRTRYDTTSTVVRLMVHTYIHTSLTTVTCGKSMRMPYRLLRRAG